MTATHAMASGMRHPKSATAALSRRVFYSLRAMSERRAGQQYRSTLGAASYSSSDFDKMRADPNCPVTKRPHNSG